MVVGKAFGRDAFPDEDKLQDCRYLSFAYANGALAPLEQFYVVRFLAITIEIVTPSLFRVGDKGDGSAAGVNLPLEQRAVSEA